MAKIMTTMKATYVLKIINNFYPFGEGGGAGGGSLVALTIENGKFLVCFDRTTYLFIKVLFIPP
jgi:hypothetical protein